MRFVDTNILLYAATGAPESAAKARVADALLREADLGLSVQVLQEFYVQATRVSRAGRLRGKRTRSHSFAPGAAFPCKR